MGFVLNGWVGKAWEVVISDARWGFPVSRCYLGDVLVKIPHIVDFLADSKIRW